MNEEIDTATSENIVLLTPDLEQWDPYYKHYQLNEEALTDYQGELIETEH